MASQPAAAEVVDRPSRTSDNAPAAVTIPAIALGASDGSPAAAPRKKRKRLRITLRGASGLPPPAAVGMKAPYATLRLGSQHYRSGIAKDAEHPEWNESVMFLFDATEDARLTIRLWEDDVDMSEIGMGVLRLDDLKRGAWTNVEVAFTGGSAKSVIAVRLGLFAFNFGRRADASPADRPDAPSPIPHLGASSAAGFTADLHHRIDELRAACVSSGGTPPDQVDAYTTVIHSCMELERQGHVADAVSVLSHVVRVAHVPDISSLALNNLACVETRRGNPGIAAHHLERAADIEGGLESARPTTLTNLAVALTALRRYAEASAVAHHAAAICERTPDCRPAVWSSALFNFAVALEYAGDAKRAAEAYEKAAAVLPTGHPSRAMLLGQAQRVHDAHGIDGNGSLITSMAAALRSKRILASEAPEPSRERPGLVRTLGPLPAHLKAAAVEDTSIRIYAHATKPHRLRRLLDKSDMSPMAIRALSPLTTPRRAASTTPTRGRHQAVPWADTRSSAATRPEWNTDPFPDGHPMCHRSVVKLGIPLSIEQHINERYVSRKILPLLTDLIYKEQTRRAAIAAEWKRQLRAMQRIMALHAIVCAEDATRAELESDQHRTRLVIQNWIRGKAILVRGILHTEANEAKQRDGIWTEQQREAVRLLHQHAAVIRQILLEENARQALERERADDVAALKIKSEAALSEIVARDLFKDLSTGVADALTVWALEAVLTPSQALELMPPFAARSLFVLERYAYFGHPASFQAPGSQKRRKTSAT